jgi:hypothetical protein
MLVLELGLATIAMPNSLRIRFALGHDLGNTIIKRFALLLERAKTQGNRC